MTENDLDVNADNTSADTDIVSENREDIADLWRQLGFFNPQQFKKKIHVIGAGATGSHIVDTLSSMGITSIIVYDFDVVESHNLPNQIYTLDDVGKPKVVALQQHIKRKMGLDIEVRAERVEKIDELSGYLILCTDSMESQKEILLSSARQNPKVTAVLETRMGIDQGRIYFFDPNNKIHLKKWMGEWYSDADAAESPCNMRAISSTAKLVSALAAHRIIVAEKLEDDENCDLVVFNKSLVSMDGENINYKW